MEVKSFRCDGIVVAELNGELDTVAADGVLHELMEIAAEDAAGVVLDCSRVVYIASLGISAILHLAKSLDARHISIRIAGPSRAIRQVLEIVEMESFVPIDASVDESVAALSGMLQLA